MTRRFSRIRCVILLLGIVAISLSYGGSSRAQGSDPRSLTYDGHNIWIANYGSNTVTKLDPSTGAVVGNYPVGVQPISVTYYGFYIYVANHGSSTVSKLLASTGALLTTYPVGPNPSYVLAPQPIGGGGGVAEPAGIPTPCPCFFTNNHDKTFTRVRIADGLTTTYTLANTYVSFTSTTKGLFLFPNIVGLNTTVDIALISAVTGQVTAQYYAGANAVSGVTDGINLWVVNDNATTTTSSVTKFDIYTDTVVGTYQTGHDSRSAAFDGTNIWVTNYTDGTVSKRLASNGQALATYNVGTGPIAVIFDGTYIWVLNNIAHTVMKLQPSNGAILGTFPA
jgi:YVTN family beta-propeller protein